MRISPAISLPLLAAGFLLSGCTSDRMYSWDYIKGDLSPEMAGVSETKLDQERDLAVTNNANLRAMSDDFGRLLLTDQPSLLTPYPMINPGGNPQ